MELCVKKLNPLAMQIGAVYRVVGDYKGAAINVLAVCTKADDNGGEYIIIKDYSIFDFNCYGDIFKLNLNNYNDFTTFTRVKPNELRVYDIRE